MLERSQNSGTYSTLHYCRAVAALLVAAYHAAGNLAKETYLGRDADWLAHIFHFGGAAGVAFFFVLSGFIVTHVHWHDINRPARLTAYLHKRLARVYPSFWVVFLAVCTVALLTPSLRASVPDDPAVIAKALLLVPQDPAMVGGLGSPVIVVAWSLHYEMLFYLLFGLFIVNTRLFVVAVLVWMAGVAYWKWHEITTFPASFFGNSIVMLFLMGMGTAFLLRHAPRFARPGWIAVVGALGFLSTSVADEVTGWAVEPNWLYLAYGLFGSLLVFGLTRYEQSASPKICAFAFELGEASYALYLIHFPLIALLSKLAVRVQLSGPLGALTGFAVILSACILASLAFHRFVERPLLRTFRRKRGVPA